MPDFSFKSGERLKSRKVIGQLFEEGQSFSQYPLRLVWIEVAEIRGSFPAQVAITVPKRRFRRAVIRNQIKRKIREAYRLRKHRIYRSLEQRERQWALMIIYTGQEALPYAEIAAAMDRMLGRFVKKQKARPEDRTNPS